MNLNGVDAYNNVRSTSSRSSMRWFRVRVNDGSNGKWWSPLYPRGENLWKRQRPRYWRLLLCPIWWTFKSEVSNLLNVWRTSMDKAQLGEETSYRWFASRWRWTRWSRSINSHLWGAWCQEKIHFPRSLRHLYSMIILRGRFRCSRRYL